MGTLDAPFETYEMHFQQKITTPAPKYEYSKKKNNKKKQFKHRNPEIEFCFWPYRDAYV